MVIINEEGSIFIFGLLTLTECARAQWRDARRAATIEL